VAHIFSEVDATGLNYQLATVKRVDLVEIRIRLQKIYPKLNRELGASWDNECPTLWLSSLGGKPDHRHRLCRMLGKTPSPIYPKKTLDEVQCTVEYPSRRAESTVIRQNPVVREASSDA
jgi:hypothetical protein